MGAPERHTARVAAYVVFERNGKVLLLRRASTGYRDGWYSLPSGHLEGKESATAVAIREGMEEVGVRLAPGQLEIVHVMHRNAPDIPGEYIDFYFRASSWERVTAVILVLVLGLCQIFAVRRQQFFV